MAPALGGVSFTVAGGSSVGVVGRSGAGKSTLLALLLRLREPTEGRILIDGVDVARLGLQLLRRRLAILPQEPLLFPGTCRENLDPFGEHSDEELRCTLRAVGLGSLAVGTSAPAGSSGRGAAEASALSVGERQLLALARLMLRKEQDSRVVLFDEPTSSVDAATDQRVQEALRTRFGTSTVLTVAHRLQTVVGADRILVLDAGRVVEFGPPCELLADESSRFAALAREAGDFRGPEKAPPSPAAAPSGLSSPPSREEVVRLHAVGGLALPPAGSFCGRLPGWGRRGVPRWRISDRGAAGHRPPRRHRGGRALGCRWRFF
ncbi:unnamed protein product [Prorocentrum cordatum]|uniref:ABC transporter domain-containing protein n=1 Tax=Prorocentrum cordatum TaxID=2364126 RepID=A0ABN9VQH3_9DINO|nr:unnamed protein product [Polarella glacialis]